jgi:deoxycytidine triphosphate deaminase
VAPLGAVFRKNVLGVTVEALNVPALIFALMVVDSETLVLLFAGVNVTVGEAAND